MSVIVKNKYNIFSGKRNALTIEDKLIEAIKAGDMFEVKRALNTGVNVNYKNEQGFTPLMYSAVTGINIITRLLLQAGADIEERNKNGLTALVLSKFNGTSEVYETLIKANADEEYVRKFALTNEKLEDGEKYSYKDIIKHSIYCEKPKGKKRMLKVLDTMDKYGDNRVKLIMACTALYTMENDWSGHPLEIFASESPNVSPFTGDDENVNILGGYYIYRNIVQTSNFLDNVMSARVLVHELMHKVHVSVPDMKIKNLFDSSEEFKNRIYKLPSNVGTEEVKKWMIDRVEETGAYMDKQSQLMENIADVPNMIIYANSIKKKDPKRAKGIFSALGPLLNFFDENMAPQMMDYILQNENFNKLDLPDELKIMLRKHKNQQRNVESRLSYEKGICAFSTTKEKIDQLTVFLP